MIVKTHLIKLYLMAISDGHYSPEEQDLLVEIGKRYDYSEKDIVELTQNSHLVLEQFPTDPNQKLEYIYDLCKMMWIDKNIDVRETASFYNISKSMGIGAEKAHGILSILISGLRENADKKQLLKSCLNLFQVKPVPIQIGPTGRLYISKINKEFPFTPMGRALYIFFLRNRDGVRFVDLQDHKEEIEGIYRQVSNKNDLNAITNSLNRVVNPLENAFNVNKTRINKAINDTIEASLVDFYLIKGSAGAPFFIPLPRENVISNGPWLQ